MSALLTKCSWKGSHNWRSLSLFLTPLPITKECTCRSKVDSEYAKIDGEDIPFLSSSPASRRNRELSVDRVVMLRGAG